MLKISYWHIELISVLLFYVIFLNVQKKVKCYFLFDACSEIIIRINPLFNSLPSFVYTHIYNLELIVYFLVISLIYSCQICNWFFLKNMYPNFVNIITVMCIYNIYFLCTVCYLYVTYILPELCLYSRNRTAITR